MKVRDIITEWKKGASKSPDPTLAHDTDITMQADRVEDHDFDGPYDPGTEQAIDKTRVTSAIESQLTKLPERMQELLKMRFGFGEYEETTLADIAKHFGLSNERVRQIEAKALRMLRHPNSAEHLKPMLAVKEDGDKLKKAMKKPPTATKQPAETKARMHSSKDKRYGTRAEQKAKADKAAAEVRKITKDSGEWQSSGDKYYK